MTHTRSFDRRPGRSTRPRDARDAAFLAVQGHVRRFPDLLPASPDTSALSAQDTGLARALYRAVVTRWSVLRFLAERHLTSSWDRLQPPVRAALLVGGAQIAFMDGIPVHAALHETVELVKRHAGRKPAGLVNAVLRRVASDVTDERRGEWRDARDELPLAGGGARVLSSPLLPENDEERLAITSGITPWALSRWRATHGDDIARRLAWHSIGEAPVILNTAHLLGPLPEGLEPHEAPGASVVRTDRVAMEALLDARADVWVQDPTSAGAVESIAELRPRVVLDLCAGTGTKTRQLAAAFPEAEIVASEIDTKRLDTLRARFADSAQVRVRTIGEVRETSLERADLVLLDVPCSNSGVLARRPEARHRLSSAQLARLVEIQRQLVADAIPLLARGGTILYATCSIDREENEALASWAAKWHGFQGSRERRAMPGGGPGLDAASYRDGGYSVLLTR